MKRLATIITTGFLMLLPLTVQAVRADTTTTTTAAQQKIITTLKTKAAREITRRLTTLNNLVTEINASAKLAATDKASLLSQVQTEISGLTALQTKINNDTDLATLRTDVQSIVTEYRVYRLIVPKAWIERSADNIDEIAAKLTTYANDLQDRINKAKANGQDVTSLQTTLTDMQAQITAAQTAVKQAVTDIGSITPDQYNANPSVVNSARTALQQARTDLMTARQDAVTIRQGLEGFNANPSSQSQNSVKSSTSTTK